ncbi:MAG: hypothetical protein JWQ91_535 [Aeromicrobium sp.]|uniref:hypothetical protein n=1 Tax=Aeromicrobium sp. TaxID=1871063 RepID=UPI0026321466|nr:hypothetical protein [Aeromicrobium sp.]MCW2823618.1 hypothetical protein [Aeromicrobium sp.]
MDEPDPDRQLEVDGDTSWSSEESIDVDIPRLMLLSNVDEYISYARDPRRLHGVEPA